MNVDLRRAPQVQHNYFRPLFKKERQNHATVTNVIFLFLDEKNVLKLMDMSKNPFPKRAPKFLRSKKYHYHFTTDFSQPNWWTREEVGEYSPMISKDDPPAIREYLTNIGILKPPSKSQKSTNKYLAKFLKFLRSQIIQPHHYIVLGLIIFMLSIIYLVGY